MCSILYLASRMGMQYLAVMGRNLETKKKLTPFQKMNIVGFNTKNIMNSVGIFNDNVGVNNQFYAIILGRIMFFKIFVG